MKTKNKLSGCFKISFFSCCNKQHIVKSKESIEEQVDSWERHYDLAFWYYEQALEADTDQKIFLYLAQSSLEAISATDMENDLPQALLTNIQQEIKNILNLEAKLNESELKEKLYDTIMESKFNAFTKHDSPKTYLKIIKELIHIGELDKALLWAKNGLDLRGKKFSQAEKTFYPLLKKIIETLSRDAATENSDFISSMTTSEDSRSTKAKIRK